MATYGYARVSTTDQDVTIQDAALRAAGCEVIRSEKCSGTSTAGRTELQTLIDFARKGDTIVVTRIDRLARSIADLAAIVRTLERKGVALRATDQPIDTATATGRCFLQMLGVFAEFERCMIRERVNAGLARAKERGTVLGRRRTRSAVEDRIRALRAEGMGIIRIGKTLGIGTSVVQRVVAPPATSGPTFL